MFCENMQRDNLDFYMMWVFIINVRKSRFMIYRNVSVHWNFKSEGVIYFCRINQSFARIVDSKPSQFFFYILTLSVFFMRFRIMWFACRKKIYRSRSCQKNKAEEKARNKSKQQFLLWNSFAVFLSLKKRGVGQTSAENIWLFSRRWWKLFTSSYIISYCQGNLSIRNINCIVCILLK